MKLTSWLALLFAAAAIVLALTFLLLRVPLDRIGALVVAGFVLAAAFFANPEPVSGWITRVLDRLPSFGRPKE